MAGSFKFKEFLSQEEQDAFDKLREKLGGKVVYSPYPKEDQYKKFLVRRNQNIQRMFAKLKYLGLENREIYAEITLRLSCAKGLSVSRIRAIVHGYRSK